MRKSVVPVLLVLGVAMLAGARASAQASEKALTAAPAVEYYVDSSMGSDSNSCTAAQSTTAPKKTVNGVMLCDPGPGDVVRFRGDFTETIFPSRSGTVLYDVLDIVQVDGSVVTFGQTISGVEPATDYVTVYGSRRGNSGAFAILSVAGNAVTVNTQDLPGGRFLPETAADPGVLQAAILRPVHFTAWDKSNLPIFNPQYQTYHAINRSVIMVSYLKSISGDGYSVWPAFEVDGNNGGNSDFQIFDHLEVTNAESAISIEAGEFQSNCDILQYNNIHDVGAPGYAMDEIIYWGHWGRPDLNHNFVQIMYNKIGPHKSKAMGDGIDIKQSVENATIFGNELVGLIPQACADAPMKIAGINAFIANNYLHDIITPIAPGGCGISITDDEPGDPSQGGQGAIVVNNIVANVNGPGIKVVDTSDVQVLNNTIYGILPEPGCDPDAHCMEFSMGILLHNWQAPLENVVIKNNIVQAAHIGIGRYIGSHEEYRIDIDSDHNIAFDTTYPFRGTITQNAHDRVVDPRLANPQGSDFSILGDSPAIDAGIDSSSVFRIDNHDASSARWPYRVGPAVRAGVWDIGAYEFGGAAPPIPTFADVPFSHPYNAEIEALHRAGYTAGCSTNPLLYCPEATMNRAESAVFVERGIHTATYEPPTPALQTFADMPLDSWAAKWVNGLWADQYTAGCGTNPWVYCPWQGHTRAEGCVFYLRMLNGASYEPAQPTQQTFADVPLNAWYAKWVKAAYDAGLIGACQRTPDLRFCPEDPLTRALAAHMMVQAKGLQ